MHIQTIYILQKADTDKHTLHLLPHKMRSGQSQLTAQQDEIGSHMYPTVSLHG